jgi:hypothetical protein
MAEYRPTINEEVEVGGSRNFGSSSFVPSITNLSGTHNLSGVYQKMGKLLFWAVELNGTSTTTSSVFTPPITPQKVSAAANYAAGEISHGGLLWEGTTVVAMNDNGTYTLANGTTTNDIRRLTGWYWTK